MADVTFADVHVSMGLGDPGGLSPLTGGPQNPVTDRWYDLLPAMYWDADGQDTSTSAGWPLYGFMDSCASVLVDPTTIASRIADGQLTDPALADDAWIPWLAQAVGVYGSGVAEWRQRLANLTTSAAVGSRDYLTILTQTFLSGTKSCTVTSAEPWGIRITVRADELDLIGGSTDTLTAALYATGRIPSGFLIQCVTASETWAQIAAIMPTWSASTGATWARLGSIGLAGGGAAYGGVQFGTGLATGTGGTAPGTGMAYVPTASGSSGDKKILFHYFSPYPVSVDNGGNPLTDYWHNAWLTAAMEGSIDHRPYGGQVRNRPLPRAPKVGADWKQQDAADEVRTMLACGGDGWYIDIMGFSGANWDRMTYLRDAANSVAPTGTIKVVPMLDTNGGGVISGTSDAIADVIAQFTFSNPTPLLGGGYVRLPSAWFLADNRLVVSCFLAEGKSVAWWQALAASFLTRYGVTIAFNLIFLNSGAAAGYAAVNWGSGAWGQGADPLIPAGTAAIATATHGRGEKYSGAVWAQYCVPDASPNPKFDEARNLRTYIAYWNQVISDNADMIQVGTWSDYSEDGEVSPSTNSGYCLLDIAAYYIAKLRTGAFPTITRDVVYLCHRNQLLTGNTFRSPETLFYTQIPRGSMSAVSNDVEVFTFLTAPADITVTIGGVAHTFTAPAGVNSNVTWPLALGTVSVSAKRGGVEFTRIDSPIAVTNTPYNDHKGYYTMSSQRGTAQQYDATNV